MSFRPTAGLGLSICVQSLDIEMTFYNEQVKLIQQSKHQGWLALSNFLPGIMGDPPRNPFKTSAAPFSRILPLYPRHNCTHRPRCFKAPSFHTLGYIVLASWIVRHPRSSHTILCLTADQWIPQNHTAIEIFAMRQPTR